MVVSRWGRAGLGLALAMVLLAVAWTPAQAGEAETLTNEGVIQLCGLGLGDDVVVAKIKQAAAVDFALEIDDLAELKEAGVSGPVIAAMLERSTAAAPVLLGVSGGIAPPPASRAEVLLETADGPYELRGMYGSYSMTHAFVTVLAYMNYDGLQSPVRTTDVRPEFLVATDKNPRGLFFVVKAESDDDDGIRSVKAGQMSMYNMQSFLLPDDDWTLDYTASEVESGLWRLELAADLPPGEYGLWKAAGADMSSMNAYLFDFAIDGDAKPKKK